MLYVLPHTTVWQIKQSTSYLVETVDIISLYALEVEIMLILDWWRVLQGRKWPWLQSDFSKVLVVLLLLYHVFSASSAKHASLFPLPGGRHLFGNVQEENVGTSSRSVVWKQKLSWSNLIMRRSQMPARNLQTLFWPSPSSRILCDWSSQLRLGCRSSSFRGAPCEDSYSQRQVVFLASLTACKITRAKMGEGASLALQG